MIDCAHQGYVELVDAVLRTIRIGMLRPSVRSRGAEVEDGNDTVDRCR